MKHDQAVIISKKLSYALRHHPEKYGVELDEEGWTDLSLLLDAINIRHHFTPPVTEETVRQIMAHSDKKRFEISDGRIRALYGHSLPVLIHKEPAEPPSVLYHGTAHRFLSSIMQSGLQPMGRQYVHLSADYKTADQVGQRRDSSPVILSVDTAAAQQMGIRFYRGNDSVWLADRIPADCLVTIRK